MYEIINTPVSNPLPEEDLSNLLLTDTFPEDKAHFIFSFFTELSAETIWKFSARNEVALAVVGSYYRKHVKPMYSLASLDDLFKYV